MDMKHLFDRLKGDRLTVRQRFSMWWWIGVPLFVILVSYGPFLLMNCVVHAAGASCWRVPMVGQIVFDLSVYSATLVSTSLGLNETALLPVVFQRLFRAAHLLIPSASPAELWLFFRILFGTVIWWMLSWTLSAWTDLSRTHRRISATILWLAIFLPLGFRPGVYSWFMPFGLVALFACARTVRLMQTHRINQSIIWTILGIAISTVYAWFFIFVCFWFAIVWCEWLILRLEKFWIIYAWLAASLAGISVSVVLIWRYNNFLAWKLEEMYRVGFAFTHMPMLSTMLFASIGWLIAMFVVIRNADERSGLNRYSMLFLAWLVIVFAWCSSIFMGVYIHNDHFRTLVMLFAWISSVSLVPWSDNLPIRKDGWMMRIVCVGAIAVSAMYIARPYAFDGDQLNTVHLFVWLALACVSISILWPKRLSPLRLNELAIFFLLTAATLGGLQYVLMFKGEFQRWPSQQKYASLFVWMRQMIPESDRVCADPKDAEFIGSQSGRFVFFTEQNVYPASHESVRRQLLTFSSIRLVDDDTVSRWNELLGYNFIVCGQFGFQKRILAPFISKDRLDQMLGCDRAGVLSDQDFVKNLSLNFGTIREEIVSTCPWVIVPQTGKAAWKFPSSYQKAYQDENFEVYHTAASMPF